MVPPRGTIRRAQTRLGPHTVVPSHVCAQARIIVARYDHVLAQ